MKTKDVMITGNTGNVDFGDKTTTTTVKVGNIGMVFVGKVIIGILIVAILLFAGNKILNSSSKRIIGTWQTESGYTY